MSTMPPYAEPQFHPEAEPIARRTSMLAVTSLVLAILACCPIVGLLGPLLGVIALILIMLNPAVKGAGIAIAAIIVGVALQGVVLFGLYRVADAIQKRPVEFMQAIEAGDWDQARAAGHGRAVAATDEEYAAFAQALDAEFGTFSDWTPGDPPPGWQPNQNDPVLPFPFVATTSKGGDVEVVFEIVLVDEVSGEFPMRPRSVEIFRADGTSIVFPPAAPEAPPTPPAAPAEGDADAGADADAAGDPDAAPDAGEEAGGGGSP